MTGPVTYRDNGEYVELRFQHLVSKIRIGTLSLITATGVTKRDARGTITFIGMPQTATFDRHPKSGGGPVVTPNNKEGDLFDVTYDLGQVSVFYIPPETDFSKLRFRIHLTNPEYNAEGDYFGDFSQVVFDREVYQEWDADKKETVLYAGEEMILNLTLTQGHGVGVTLTIQDWNMDATGTGKAYSHPGIYSSGQGQDVSNVFAGDYTDEQAEDIFEKYGDDENVFFLYDDIDLSQVNFSMGKDYVLDGMGHTIHLQPTSRNPHQVRIGNCRDVYITDGEFTVYIDSDGNLFKVDEKGNLIQPGKKLPELVSSQNSYNIDLETGEVRPQTTH